MVVFFVCIFIVNTTSATAQMNDIYGDWECVAVTDEAEDYIYSLCFTKQGDVTFVAGWYQSEIVSVYAGQFTIEDEGVLELDMTDIESSATLMGTYSFVVSEGTLILTKQCGDSLSYLFEVGEPMTFTNI